MSYDFDFGSVKCLFITFQKDYLASPEQQQSSSRSLEVEYIPILSINERKRYILFSYHNYYICMYMIIKGTKKSSVLVRLETSNQSFIGILPSELFCIHSAFP